MGPDIAKCIMLNQTTAPDGITAQLFTLLCKASTDFTDASVYADKGNEMLNVIMIRPTNDA